MINHGVSVYRRCPSDSEIVKSAFTKSKPFLKEVLKNQKGHDDYCYERHSMRHQSCYVSITTSVGADKNAM